MSSTLVAADGIGLALRALTLLSALLIIGALPISALVLRPLRAEAGSPQVMSRLTGGLQAACAVLAVASVGTLADLVKSVRLVQPELKATAAWQQVLASDLGGWTAVRLPVALFCVFVLPLALTGGARAVWYAWALLAGVLALTLPMTSHAASTGRLGIAVDVVHLVAGAVWLAGVVALAVVIPSALRTGRSSRRRTVLLTAATGFSRLAVLAVSAAVVTGVVQAVIAGVPLDGMAGTTWGAAATAKVVLFAAVLAAGLANHHVLIGRLDAARSRTRIQADSSALLSVVSLEVALGAAMVLAAALLVSVPQP